MPSMPGDPALWEDRTKSLANQAQGSSFSGTDVTVTIVMPQPSVQNNDGNPYGERASVVITGEMQTITVSSARSIAPVRTLGTVPPRGYTRGARTIAGTMIFSNLLRDSFIEHYQKGRDSGETDFDGFFVDQLPAFDIVLTAANEHGAIANSVIKGVTISNFGTTMSIDDIYMESTYTYVAENFWPFVKDSATVMRLLSDYDKARKASQEAMRWVMNVYDTVTKEYGDGTSPHSVESLDDLVDRAIGDIQEPIGASLARERYLQGPGRINSSTQN